MKGKVLIIGAGFMGLALSKYFQDYKIETYVYDNDVSTVSKLIYNMEFRNVKFITNLEHVSNVDFVIEAVPEKLDVKQNLFSEIETLFSKSVFCTNTSSFLISEVGMKMKDKSRLIGTHFFSPADITPLVEVIPNKETNEQCIKKIMNFLNRVGKKPILLKREIPGFVANRLQTALAREAISLIEKGIVTAEELDYIAKWSIGIRLAITGPLEQRDINGIDTHYEIAKYVYPSLENATSPLNTLKALVNKEKHGIKTLSGFYNWDSNRLKEQMKMKEKTIKNIIAVLQSEES